MITPRDPIILRELPVIWKIIQDETWLEGERRGCYVRSDDQVVRERVCTIVLRIGQQLRDAVSAAVAQATETRRPISVLPRASNYDEAA